MWIKSIHIRNIKGFADSDKIDFSPKINVLIGNNNAGKSTILKSIYMLQKPDCVGFDDIRKGIHFGQIVTEIENIDSKILRTPTEATGDGAIRIILKKNESAIDRSFINKGNSYGFSASVATEPDNFIYPFLSKRKVADLDQRINSDLTTAITDDLRFLHAKIARISSSQYPAYSEYDKICRDVLGFLVTTSASKQGMQGGLIVNNFENIPIETMGDGVPNILGLIVNLCIAKNKLFLIEEPENDIHPKALKSLLEFIIQKSETNQFIITTHSNIVAKYLGSESNTRLFHIKSELIDSIPTSKIKKVGDDPDDRIKVLEDLGYELFDFDLWKAYLILEESSAERIIRDFLIPEFVPDLKYKLKTIAAQGISNVEPKFNDFHRLFVFIHTSPAYKDRAWVIVDGDKEGQETINEMIKKFKSWDESHFKCFSKNDFEEFFPERFKESISRVLAISNKDTKREEKKKLLQKVLDWIHSDKETAKREFMESAKEVIQHLSTINEALRDVS